VVSEVDFKGSKGRFFKSSVCLQDTVEKAIYKKGKRVKIILIADGGNIVPVEVE
jgi:hypothetical protein